jgi:hypothetical protein
MAGGRVSGRGAPEPLASTLGTLMGRLGYRKRSPALFAMAAWERAVGEAIARHAVPERVEHDTLHVVVDGAPWANELRWMEGSLVAQLNAVCGRQVVSRLRFRIGTLPEAPVERNTPPLPSPTPAARAAARLLAEEVPADLRGAWQRLVARGLTRGSLATTKEDEA